MSEKLKLMVGSELKSKGGTGNALYRVVKLSTGSNGHTTIDIDENGQQLPKDAEFTWCDSGYTARNHEVASNPPAAVGDLVKSGNLVYLVESYDPITDVITIRVSGNTSEPHSRIKSGDYRPAYSYTRKDWPAALSPFIEQPKKQEWKPEVGKLAKIVSIKECCEDDAKYGNVEVGDVREVSGLISYGMFDFAGTNTRGGIHCELEEPGKPYIPKAGEKVIVTAVAKVNRFGKPITNDHKVGSEFVVTTNGLRTESGDALGYAYLGDSNDNYSRCIVKPVKKGAAKPVAAVASTARPVPGSFIKVTGIHENDHNPGCKLGGVIEVKKSREGFGTINGSVIIDHPGGCVAVMKWEPAIGPKPFLPKAGSWVKILKNHGGAGSSEVIYKEGNVVKLESKAFIGNRPGEYPGSVVIFAEGNVRGGIYATIEKAEEPKKLWDRHNVNQYVQISYIGMNNSQKAAERLGISIGDVRFVKKVEDFTGLTFEGISEVIWCDVIEPAEQKPKIVKPKAKESVIAFTPWNSIEIGRMPPGMINVDIGFSPDKPKLTGFKTFAQQSAKWETQARLTKAQDQLGPNALSLLADIADRLVVGRAHGDFEKQLDWSKEAYEEDLDAIVYRTMRLKAEKKKAA